MIKDNVFEKTCCFTGHRNIPFGRARHISKCLEKTIEDLLEQGFIYFGAGGALGFDTLASKAVIKVRKRYPEIKLILVLPCKTQADSWACADRQTYEEIKVQADKVVYISEEYTKGCMLERNRHLVNSSSVCVCYLTKDTGGTSYTVKYAKQKGLRIINLA